MTLSWIVNAIVGLLLIAGGGWLVYSEVHTPPVHSGHLYVGVGVALLGALLVNPAPILTNVQKLVVVVLPIIPWGKAAAARRASAGTTTAAVPPVEDTDK